MAEREASSSEYEGRGYAAAMLLGVFAVLAVALLPFVPLLLSLLEQLTLGTSGVEGFCEQIGIHDELTVLYQAMFDLFN